MQNIDANILVPWDFTELCEFALQHAIEMAKISHQSIVIVHVIDKENDIEKAEAKLKQIASAASANSGVPVSVIIRKGNLLKTLRSLAVKEMDVSVVVMKTGGPKGSQKYMGSRALKIIIGAQIPFLVIQSPPATTLEERIVVTPIDFRYENKEKIKWIQFLSKYYKVKIFMVRQETRDAGFKKNILNNIMFTQQQLDKKGIEYEIATVKNEKPFQEEVVDFAKEKKADMLLVMLKKNIGLVDHLIGLREQYYLTNPQKIPVICVNPNINLRKFQTFN